MSDLLKHFEAWVPTASAKDKAEALKVIEEQITAVMQGVQDMAKHLNGATPEYIEMWGSLVEKNRIDLMELEQVKMLLCS